MLAVRRRYTDTAAPDTPEGSLAAMEAEAREKEGERDVDGRLIPCYPGIRVPLFPPQWDRGEIRAALRVALYDAGWLPIEEAAKKAKYAKAELFVDDLSRLAWYGWTWKTDARRLEIRTAIQRREVVRLSYTLSTPGGSLVAGFVCVSDAKDAP